MLQYIRAQYDIKLLPGLKFGGWGELEKEVRKRVKSEKTQPHLGFETPEKFYIAREGATAVRPRSSVEMASI